MVFDILWMPLIKKALKKPFDPHTRWFNGLEEMKMMWAFGVLEPLGMALGQKEDEGTHTHMIVFGHLDTYYTLDVDAMMESEHPVNLNDVAKAYKQALNDTKFDHLKLVRSFI